MKDLSTINHQSSIIIGIDGNEANVKRRVGSNIYAFKLLWQFYKYQISNIKYQKHISKIKKNNFIVFLKDKPLEDLPSEKKWWQYRVLKPKFLWTQWRLSLELMRSQEKPNVFFSPGHYSPGFCPVPLVVSILDVSYLRFPSQFRVRDLWQLRILTKRSVAQAVRILTISQASKDDIIEYYGVGADKITVAYPGINLKAQMSKLKSTPQILKLKKKHGIKGNYLIYVGTLQPRKNLVRLIEAFKKVKSQKSKVKSTTQKLKLVIVGKKGWLYDEIFTKVKELKLENDVVFTGFVSDGDLPYLIKGAVCLVLVSLYEGFGLPVAESMSLGVPVVTSNVSSLPEVAGEAGILVDPYKVEEIAKGLEKVLGFYKKEPDKYQELIKKGQEQAKKFSWEKCASEVLKVLEEVAKENF